MGKLSGLGQETSFALSDFLVKVKSGGVGDVLVSLANFLTAAGVTTRNAAMNKGADNIGGATYPSQLEANEIHLTGTVANYGRLDVLVPMDYVAGTTATIVIFGYSDSTNNQTVNYYVGAHAVGSSFSSWNVASNITTAATLGMTANAIVSFNIMTIPAANLVAGALVTVGFKPSAAVTGNIYITGAYLQYTAKL
jgi:hypothetical protein